VGVRLLERSTRSVRCTEVGFYDQCRAILADFDAAERAVAVQRAEPVGLVRMSCPTGLAQFVLAKILPEFLARYPKVRLQVLATNRAIDLIEDNVDIAIRARVRLADEATTMRTLYKSELIFVASSAFAKAHQISTSADTISSLPFLSFLETADMDSHRSERRNEDSFIRSSVDLRRFQPVAHGRRSRPGGRPVAV
jgi:DNA-binding transcriptional LysR family regulator